MRPRPLLRHHAAPTWMTSPPQLRQDTPNAAVHARVYVRRRTWDINSSGLSLGPAVDLLGEVVGGSAAVPGGRPCCSAVTPLCAEGEALSEHGLSSSYAHDGAVEHDEDVDIDSAHESSPVQLHLQHTVDHTSMMPALEAVAVSAVEIEEKQRGEKVEKPALRREVNRVHLLQQGLIHRLATLEERRDWRGVLTALVRCACLDSWQLLSVMKAM